jgi:hypothetical protein
MKTPQLRHHKAKDLYYARYWHERKDKFQWFTRDKAESTMLFTEWLPTWAALKSAEPPRPSRSDIRIVQVAELWLTHIELTAGRPLMRQYRAGIANFINLCGQVRASAIDVSHLQHLAADLESLGYSRRTVNAYTRAPKRMLTWATRTMVDGKPMIPPLDFSQLTLSAPPRPAPSYRSPREVRAYIKRAATPPRGSPDLVPWLMLIYLTCARPSEVYRMIRCRHGTLTEHRRAVKVASPSPQDPTGHDRFRTIANPATGHRERVPCAFETRGKTQRRTGQTRIIPLSAEALAVLDRATPCFSHAWFLELTLNATTTDPSAPRGAKVLRSWGASELRRQGVSREDIRQVLGHSTAEPIDHYVDESLAYLRETVSLLTLRRGGASTPLRGAKAKQP